MDSRVPRWTEQQLRDVRRRVFKKLRSDGRASFTRIGEELGVPRHLVASIVERAVAADELRLTVSISPDLLGLERFAYTQVLVDGPVAPVRDALVALSATTFVADVASHFPIEAEIRVGADPRLRETLDVIAQLPGVREVQTSIYESIEANQYSPLRTGGTRIRVDTADRAMIGVLQQNCRASLRELGDAAGLSPSGARVRFERLLRHEAIRPVGIPVRAHHSDTTSLRAGIRAAGPASELLPHLLSVEPEFLAVAVGRYDFIATLTADTVEEVLEITERLRSFALVAAVDVSANLRIVKERYGDGDRIAVAHETGSRLDALK
ncbi:AsnC family transcriptional regulator [Microbacterium sp.]|uniref:AsnC family transcriptional regulator n=1 Tax=Microbacterium sp. TaxID=51671 RepID=UPI0039E56DBA